jgi:hypothetical protein
MGRPGSKAISFQRSAFSKTPVGADPCVRPQKGGSAVARIRPKFFSALKVASVGSVLRAQMVRETHPTIFMVLGVPLEYEWLVPKPELGNVLAHQLGLT